MASIIFEQVSKTYANGFEAVTDFNLEVGESEFMVLVGPSGCGKTTALRMVAGLETVSGGDVRIGERVVNDVAAKDRDIAMIFQNYALYPHMTVRENIAFALKLRKVPKAQARQKVADTAAMLGLTDYLESKPGQLSGGQRQRVAMGRAIVREPSAFLMDEPLSNLDAKLRVQMRSEITGIQRRLGVATLYVTHDQVEAMTMGHRVCVLRGGVLQQCDTPQKLYDNPANLFVASFLGSPPMNLFEAQLTQNCDSIVIGSQQFGLPKHYVEANPTLKAYADRPIVFGIRPEDLLMPGPASTGAPYAVIRARAAAVEALGAEQLLHFTIDAASAGADDPDDEDPPLLSSSAGGVRSGLGVARVDSQAQLSVGALVELLFDSERAHAFDPKPE